ncbi:MAG: ClpXP protease specificity-enhancing factor [Rhodocyclaceae bacterium]|nr:ClpXP protease specificity-enhancing factor [Rhodocyclaceae bacterium]
MATSIPPLKPYLIRAIYDWCVDCGFTPHLAVQVNEATQVPREFVRDGQIVLNISPVATHRLVLGEREIKFEARFGGKPYSVVIPMGAVIAVFARENGQGLAFAADAESAETSPQAEQTSLGPEADQPFSPDKPGEKVQKRSSHLTRIK